MTDSVQPSDGELAIEIETGTGQLGLDVVRRLVAEAIGTGLLIIAVIGSGIMAASLSPNDVGLQLLENAAATVPYRSRSACGSVAPTSSRRRRASPTPQSPLLAHCRTPSPASSRRRHRCSSPCNSSAPSPPSG